MTKRLSLTSGEVRLLKYFDKGLEAGVRLHQFINYAIGVYGIGRMFARVVDDGRRDP
ncbi:MAG: hypothetical protein R3C68_10870 [Myxococcota bacterium]